MDDEGRGEERRSASGRREWIGSIDSPKENLTRDLRGKTRDLDFGPSDAGYARIRECTLTSWGRSQPRWSPCNQRQPGHPGPWYPAESKRGGVPWSASWPSVLLPTTRYGKPRRRGNRDASARAADEATETRSKRNEHHPNDMLSASPRGSDARDASIAALIARPPRAKNRRGICVCCE